MFSKKKLKATSILAVVLAILLVTYNLPVGALINAFAETAVDQQATTEETVTPATGSRTEEPAQPEEPSQIPETTTQYQVSVTKVGFGTVKLNDQNYKKPLQVDEKTDVAVSITPATGFEIKSVKINDESQDVSNKQEYTGTIQSIVQDTSIQVEFALKSNSITFASFQNGTITVGDNQTISSNGETANIQYGSDTFFTATPAEGYHIKSIKIDGSPIDLQKDATPTINGGYIYAFNNVTNQHTVEVEFVINTYTITFNTNDNGTVNDANSQPINSAGGTVIVEHGKDSSFTVIPNTGFHIKTIEIDQEAIDLPTDVTQSTKNYDYTFKSVKDNHTVKVTFAINTYKITATVEGGNGTVDLDHSIVDYNGTAKANITPENNSYRVASITVNGTPITDLENNESFTENSDGSFTYTLKNITDTTSIQVAFEKNPVLTGSWDTYTSITPVAGSLINTFKSGDNEVRVYSKDAELTVSAVDSNNLIDMLISRLFGGWKQTYTVTDSTSIERLLLNPKHKKNGREEVNLPGNLMLVFDREKPVINDPKLTGANEATVGDSVWYSGKVTVTGSIDNAQQTFDGVQYSTDIDKVYYTKGEYSPNAGTEATYDPATNQYSFDTVDEDYKGIYSIWAVDKAGNVSAVKTIYINIDKTAPTLADGKAAVTFKQTNDNIIAKTINFLTFGTFFNKEIEVTVKVNDDASGIKSFTLNTSDKNVVPKLVDSTMEGLTAEAVYTLDADSFKGTFNVEVTDNVNNHSPVPFLVNDQNSNMEAGNSGVVMIEKNAPEANISVSPSKDVSSNGDNQYNGDVTFGVNVQDPEAGVNTVIIDVNGQKYREYDFSGGLQTNPAIDSISTDNLPIKINQDGSYVVSVYAVDNAGNTNTVEKTIYIDRTNPNITDLTFLTDGTQQKASLTNGVELTEYGYYFKKPTAVTVQAEDPQVEYEYTSKVKSMTAYLKDYDNGKYYAVLANGSLKEIKEAEVGKIESVSTSGELTFNVPENFKGQIFAKATDHVNNTGAYETPDGTINETAAKHAKESHITIEKADTPFKDNNHLDLYSKNVNVNVIVADTYSGLKEIEWSVEASYDQEQNQHGIIKINNDKSYAAGSNADGWKQTKTEKNLVEEMAKTLTVTNNSNAIVVKVKITDRAGNTSEEKTTFSIDKTAPTMKVTYDNNSPDKDNHDFYKADRTATIVVTERNFKPEDVDYKITNTDGVIPKIGGWSTAVNAKDPDKTTHTATVHYTADGDYTFDIKYKDNAGNSAAPFAQQKFTLDKTIPVIQVAYNNNSAAQGNYYKAARTATISIKEHNFDPSRIKVTGTATNDGAPAAFPGLSGWSRNGDVNTATIQYDADGNYSFDIDFTDQAGNQAADFKPEAFVVDQTAPVLTITGVKDNSANKGDVVPVVSYSDTNFNKNAVSITLKGANRGTVKLDGAYANDAKGQAFTFKNFAKDKKVDDIYTLTAQLVDFAGNETKQTIQFSVNRFGSVYVFDKSLKEIEGKYVKEPVDVVLTETNVDTLKHDKMNVKMTKNGTPSDLKEGKDFTVTHSGGAGKWSQYKYVINKKLFAGDGRYMVALYSEDAAGNINENIDEKKKADISFGIDHTAPVIMPIDFERGKQYPVEEKSVSVSVKDNLVLEGAKIYLNGKKVTPKVEGENYTFTVPSSNSKQNVKIVAADAAGNLLSTEVNDFLVTTNPIVRWYNNTPLFMGSIGAVGVLAIAATALTMSVRKRKAVEDD